MLKTFIERPVLSTVISVILVILGLIGLLTLPIEQYPDIAPPTVQVATTYSGANADVVMKSVIIPLEEQINGVEGMTYMTSTATNDGSASILIFFERGVNPDIASVNVQNLVARASHLLPAEVVKNGVIVHKQQSSNILYMSLSSDNPDYNNKFIQNYANINIIPQIKRIHGVGDVTIHGQKDYSMRIWLKPDLMASYNLTTQEVISAITDQNIEAAPGQLGQNSNQSFQYTLKFTGRLKTPEEFGNIIIRSINNQILRVKDIANVELGTLSYQVNSMTNDKPALIMAVSQIVGSNATEIINNVKDELNKDKKMFPPGIKVNYLQDSNEFLFESIHKVVHTLIEAFILVFIVVFLFLQDFRSTIIPAFAVPVAIIGTFFFLRVFGFSVNILTLFALVLAIGIVVDDAIVVVEAVHAQLDKGEKDSKQATLNAMKEIAPAIVSITLVMAAVFIPVSFIGGTSGVFYKQFGLTLAISIFISMINALTLSPALCALFLKPHKDDNHEGSKKTYMKRFYSAFNVGFNWLTTSYKSKLHFLGKKNNRWITMAIIVVCAVILFYLMHTLPTGFVPQEDSGSVVGIVSLSPGSSLERSDEIMAKVAKIAHTIPHVKFVTTMSGVSFLSGVGSSYGSMLIKLDPWNQRKITSADLARQMTQKTQSIKGATFMFFGTPTLQGFGLSNGVELSLQDRTGGDVNKFYNITRNFLGKLNARPEVMRGITTFNPNFPQKEIHADIFKIKEAGLTLTGVMSTLQAYIGSMYICDFNLFGKQYRVMVQADPKYRSKFNDLNGLLVKTKDGTMAPITEFITLKDITGPQFLTRFNMYSSMNLTVIPNFFKGYSTGDVINAISDVAKQTLPRNYTYEYSGMTREEVLSGSQIPIIFALCLVFVYLLLAALYESYILPLAVIISLPIGLSGVFIFIFIAMMNGSGISNNIFVQISLIMLIGLLAKNAILIVEYAIQRRKQGMSIVEAAINGAAARLRPILMTSFAFILGLVPLALAHGAGAIGNKSIGISAVGGMLIGTVIGLLVIPSLFIIFQSLQEKFQKSGFVNKDEANN